MNLETNPRLITHSFDLGSNTPSRDSHQLDSDSDEEHDDDYLNNTTVSVNPDSQLFLVTCSRRNAFITETIPLVSIV